MQKSNCAECGKPFESLGLRRHCSHTCYAREWCRKNSTDRQTYSAGYYEKNREHLLVQQRIRIKSDRSTRPWHRLILACRARARESKIVCDLTDQWGEARWIGDCELTGVPFVMDIRRGGSMALSPSIDRIDPKAGYIQPNCRFILFCVNGLKNVESDAMMYFVAAQLIAKKPKLRLSA